MAQLILGTRTDEVLAVLADGVHPGRQVVTGRWDSRPLSRYRIVQVAGEPVSAFADLMERPDPEVDSITKRLRVMVFTTQERNDLETDRTMDRTRGEIVSEPNPDVVEDRR